MATTMPETSAFQGEQRLGDIVLKFPGAAEIFKQHGIDFCCGGQRSLDAAAQEKGLVAATLLEELGASYNALVGCKSDDVVDWSQVSLEQLIQHIVQTHHGYLKRMLPQLSEIAVKVLRVHGQLHGEVLSEVHRLFNSFRVEMESHLIKEEEIVFPEIIVYEQHPSSEKLQQVIHDVKELDKEHDGAGNLLKELRQVTQDYALPEDACATYTYLFQELERMESDVFQHIHLENNVLFERLVRQLKD